MALDGAHLHLPLVRAALVYGVDHACIYEASRAATTSFAPGFSHCAPDLSELSAATTIVNQERGHWIVSTISTLGTKSTELCRDGGAETDNTAGKSYFTGCID
jgi:hypothetical protein